MAHLSYVNIFAKDIEALSGFYVKVFGFTDIPAIRSPIFVVLDTGKSCLGFNALDAYGLPKLDEVDLLIGPLVRCWDDADHVVFHEGLDPDVAAHGRTLDKP